MREITVENAASYLKQKGVLNAESVEVEALGWGVSNLVLRIRTPLRWYVLKQSRPQLRTRELWRSDPERIFREAQIMQALSHILPTGVVPQVIYVDREDFFMLMEHAPAQAVVWKGELLSGRIELAVADFAGTLLGRLHEQTRGNPIFLSEFADRHIFWQLRTEPFYLRILERHPDVAPAVKALVERLDCHSEAICHGDFSPKNFLVWPERADGFFTLVDYETACFGDPAMDVGFFLSHLLLKAIRLTWPQTAVWHSSGWDAAQLYQGSYGRFTLWTRQMCELTQRFWRSYRSTALQTCTPEHEFWSRLHCAACMLARIDGTSPVDYLPEEPLRDLVRRFAKSLLQEPAASWETVLDRLADSLAQMGSEASSIATPTL